MPRIRPKTSLTELDLMVIRAGGRTEAELEAMVRGGPGFDIRCRICGILADGLYRLVMRLEMGARRNAETSHHRLAANSTG